MKKKIGKEDENENNSNPAPLIAYLSKIYFIGHGHVF
jgi:hypothetical protein